MKRYFALGVLALAVTTGVACGEPAPTPTPAPELAVAPTATPTVTLTPTQKPTPTPAPLQTFTPSPSPTATPIPIVAAQPSLEVQSLSNGLKVIVYEDHTAPVVSVNVWYRVGSRNELVGNRGLAHLMEHMMFKGSTNFGPDEHAQIIDRAGGVGNAFTSEDATGYWDKVPLEKFELALELEAERMHNLVLTQENLDSEREVVKEEFRTRIENDPISAAFETFRALAFEGTPYAWAPVGTLDDIDGITLSDLSNFYETYYAPNNAVLVVAGDVTAEGVFELAQDHFGAIPRAMAPPILSVELAEQAGFREETLEMAVQLPAVIGGYTIPGVGHEDLPALEVIQFILSAGESSRMNRSLVREQRLAVFAGGFALTFKDLGSMLIVAFFTPDKDPTQIKDALLGEIERLRAAPVAQEELQKAKNQLTAQYIFNLDSLSGVADSIGEAEVVWGDYRLFLEAQERYNDLSVADIQDVAQRYFIDEGLTLVTLKPEQETQP